MVAGEGGLGKSTLIEMLFEVAANGIGAFMNQSKPKRHKPTVHTYKCGTMHDSTTIQFHHAAFADLHMTVIDTIGFGSAPDNSLAWVPLVSLVQSQYLSYMLQAEQPVRTEMLDTRVHACVYMLRLTNSGVQPLDMAAISALEKHTNVVPVIAKADGFSPHQLAKLKKAVRAQLNRAGITFKEFKDLPSTPLAIVTGAPTFTQDKVLLAREYKYGIVDALDETTCDTLALLRILVGDYMFELMDSVENVYYAKFYSEAMRERISHALGDAGMKAPASGLETLRLVAPRAQSFFQMRSQENNQLFRERHKQLEAKYKALQAYQDHKLQQRGQDLIGKRELLEHEELELVALTNMLNTAVIAAK